MFLIGNMIVLAIVAFVVVVVLAAFTLRRVVPTNMVNIVQSRKKTESYGKDMDAGNVYYAWPSWMPVVGVEVIKLAVSNFDLSLNDYEAYDKERVPFEVDVTAFFCINDTNRAAQRVVDFNGLKEQLHKIVQGAVRKVLASDDIDTIMVERATFGDRFTTEVQEELREWGVKPVKNMELMDIRDVNGSHVIENIMAKKKSAIEKESRMEVAGNRRDAEIAEIEARQTRDIRDQEAQEALGKRTAERDQQIGIAKQLADQEVKEQEAITMEKTMAVKKIEVLRSAEIEKDRKVVEAQQASETATIRADGDLQAKKKESEGIRAEGEAKAAAATAMEMAPVTAKITLADKIATTPAYMEYLVQVEAITAYLKVGKEQAVALQGADVKVIANTGKASSGMTHVMDLFTAEGGLNIGAMVESFAQTPLGESVLRQLGASAAPARTEGAGAIAPAETAAPEAEV